MMTLKQAKELEEKLWYNNHTHSEDSNGRMLDSTNRVNKMYQYARKSCNLIGFSLTDHESMSGHIKAIRTIQGAKKEGDELFKIGLGNEIYLVDNIEKVKDEYVGGGVTKFPHFVLTAKDIIGHEALQRLSTEAYTHNFTKGVMRVVTTKEHLSTICMNPKYKGHLIASTACLGSELAIEHKNLLAGDGQARERIDRFINGCKILFGDDFYLELQPSHYEEQIVYNKFLLEYATQNNMKAIITTDAHYLNKDMAKIHEALLNSKDEEREIASFYSTTYLMSPTELWEYFESYLPYDFFISCLDNTMEIYNKIEFYEFEHKTEVPQVSIPPFNQDNELSRLVKERKEDYPNLYSASTHSESMNRYLVAKLNQGIKDYNVGYGDEILERLDTELKQILGISEMLESNLASYYLLTQDVINYCWLVSFVGVGRGSSVCYLMCYLLGITQLNPLEHDLPFWRHLSIERGAELPDIDFDIQPEKKEEVVTTLMSKYGEDRILYSSTFRTLTSKVSIQTVGRGLGYNKDDVKALTDMIPAERGQIWSIKDCVEGNPDKDKKPVKELIEALDKFPNLIEYARELEGLRTNISSHASAVFIFDKPYAESKLSMMKTPKGLPVTCFDAHEVESTGGLKLDFLVTDAMSKLRTTMDILLSKGLIEWQGDLRTTYNKYLHPSVIDFDNQNMYDCIFNGEVPDFFQFQTPLGESVLNKLNCRSFTELCSGNALMRLATKEKEQPLDRYVRYKNNIQEWYDDMTNYGLTQEEQDILKHHLGHTYGVMGTQEELMILTMDKGISNFTMGEANKIRKALAKKIPSMVDSSKELFFSKNPNARPVFLQYCWEEQIKAQLGYSFSLPHIASYTSIGLQEAHLVATYGSEFWKCACLRVNSASDTDKGVDYGKTAKAVAKFRKDIILPDINVSEKGFTVIGKSLGYGLKSISGVNDKMVKVIEENRPYTSFNDFKSKVENIKDDNNKKIVTNVGYINLIKSGCFDKLEPNRVELLRSFFSTLDKKDKLTSASLNMLKDYGILQENDFQIELQYQNAYSMICSKPNEYEKEGTELEDVKGVWYLVNPELESPFLDLFNTLIEGKDYIYNEDGLVVKKTPIEKIKKANIKTLEDFLKSKQTLEELNNAITNRLMEEKGATSLGQCELDSMYFYYSENLIRNIKSKFGLTLFDDMPREPLYTNEIASRGFAYKKYKTYLLPLTIIDKDNNTHTITGITNDDTVLSVKMTKEQYVKYNKDIPADEVLGTPKQNSWFKRGENVLLQGYRNEDEFKIKSYYGGVFEHSIMRIAKINEDNEPIIEYER